MSKVRRRDTSPELEIRSELHGRGLRYRVDLRPVPDVRSRADLVFSSARVAVFVDGCFWHRCPEHGTLPQSNREFWRQKLERNSERDAEVDSILGECGWTVIRIWEHEDPGSAADRVECAVLAGRQ